MYEAATDDRIGSFIKVTMLQESRGHFFENLRDNAKRCCSIFSQRICGCLCASHK